ncbi:glycosyltransferase family 34 protein [Apodospora peruviana]|uniref:Glycosyltransferase family 34 protein n=1 Tax=Apodospora peruviana TaxID=516989 RepID=A0AAE0I0G1_9PEZI|nr:glycosyltransferase family 34 protein [Apodospora peruviana]
MHFAYPPRKTSNPPPYLPRSGGTSRLPGLRRSRLKVIALVGIAFIVFIYILTRPSSSSGHGGSTTTKRRAPSGNPPVVLVTVLDEKRYSKAYIDTVKENRIQYAEKHGYEAFFANIHDYDLKNAPPSWASVVATRHALTRFPEARYVWFLDQNAFIMNPRLSLEEHLMKPARLESLMIKGQPVVPPDSIITTFTHLKGPDVDFVLTQDKEGLSSGSFVVRNGEWAEFLLETWFDPIYRSYNFQKAETHALEHIVQWHPTILQKLALVDQRIINAYNQPKQGAEYQEGDLVVRFAECDKIGPQACEIESKRLAQQWRKAFTSS